MIKKQPMGTAIPCSSMVQLNLPGGVIQLVTGFKIQATSRITMPIVPLKVKKPPISVFFIASTSFYIRRYYRLALTNYNGEAVRRIRQKEGGSAMNFPTALLAAAVAVVFISIVVSGVRRRKRGGGCSGGCGCSGCAGTCHLEK